VARRSTVLEGAGLLILQSVRAAILALVVAPDAVIRLIERAAQIHAMVVSAKRRDACDGLSADVPESRVDDFVSTGRDARNGAYGARETTPRIYAQPGRLR